MGLGVELLVVGIAAMAPLSEGVRIDTSEVGMVSGVIFGNEIGSVILIDFGEGRGES